MSSFIDIYNFCAQKMFADLNTTNVWLLLRSIKEYIQKTEHLYFLMFSFFFFFLTIMPVDMIYFSRVYSAGLLSSDIEPKSHSSLFDIYKCLYLSGLSLVGQA